VYKNPDITQTKLRKLQTFGYLIRMNPKGNPKKYEERKDQRSNGKSQRRRIKSTKGEHLEYG